MVKTTVCHGNIDQDQIPLNGQLDLGYVYMARSQIFVDLKSFGIPVECIFSRRQRSNVDVFGV